ncbi:MAG: TRAP transporter large permease [alpha proteobacterium HIMB114]|nr:C4-dicarboxylate ABC transporter permease [Candidatus Pelagibacter sp.]OUV87348.1 MAG: C4-dicarboxylate ABC transporter permease [Pelagibacteraceae bacterium TMED136]RZO91144.1 MAG: TRAP transporter large permease [alpha proteobacterium HIMB114]|tara:strand:- start:3397 stop:4710 length:1314 start_codon:yes stop_codon:yes gene_type:complete
MGGLEFALSIIFILLLLILLSVPIVLALGVTSFFGLAYLVGNFDIAVSLLANTAYEAIRNYVFAVIPLFVLMGELISKSGAAKDLYVLINNSLKRIPGRLTLATVIGNAIFGAVTGVSIASAAAFSRIAYPEMISQGYNKTVSLGSIAGSASLGMLIPPSILLIVWGVIAEISIGKLFVAGVIPGILLALMFGIFLVIFAIIKPGYFGGINDQNNTINKSSKSEIIGSVGVVILILIVLGGIWFGIFTPTESAGIGALFALVLAIVKKTSWREIASAVLETGKISAPILFLLIAAQMYARLLAMGGITGVVENFFTYFGNDLLTILVIMVLTWFILGMFIDSVSIILLTVPLFTPIANSFGYDPIAFAIIGIVAIEAGLLTPPLGLCVYTVKGSISDPEATLSKIFMGSVPYWIMLIILVFIIAMFPSVATWLPSLM